MVLEEGSRAARERAGKGQKTHDQHRAVERQRGRPAGPCQPLQRSRKGGLIVLVGTNAREGCTQRLVPKEQVKGRP